MSNSSTPISRPRRGGQPGNRNALKHGLYARHFPKEIRKKFVKWDLDDFGAEIQLLRMSLDNLIQSILTPDLDAELRVKLVNAVSVSVRALVGASRQHLLFHSSDNPVLVAWLDTLADHDFFVDTEPEA
jgi:hypothetical protein